MNNIFLIGMMGSGKSTAGRLLAEKKKLQFIDLDEEIEKRAGKSIPQIFSQDGEACFRKWEKGLTQDADLLKYPSVIATGGGFPLDVGNIAWMKNNGVIVWLQVSPQEVIRRITGEGRPLLDGKLSLETITDILNERLIVYKKADAYILTDAKTPQAISQEISEKV